jgi:YVTN family beta-propeller protein
MNLLLQISRRDIRRLIGCTILLSASAFVLLASRYEVATAEKTTAVFNHPTNSSPISLSADNRLIWVVNSDDDSVSVIRTDLNTVIARIKVGDEPQSVALAPDNKFAFVANAAANTVTVIEIINPDPNRFIAEVDKSVGNDGQLTTGAEPWNIVTSPDGKRVFVANSGQDTITVIEVNRNENNEKDKNNKKPKIKIIGNVDLRESVCNAPDHERRFQPRGLAVTQDNSQLYVTRFLSFTKPEGGKQGDDNGREGLVCRLEIDTDSNKISDYTPVSAIRLAAQVTGFQVDSNNDGIPDDTSAFPNQLQGIVIRGDHAYLPNIAASPQGPQLFNVTTQAFVNRIDGINGTTQSDAGALNLNLGARNPEAGKPVLFFANPWAIAFTNQSGPGAAYVVSAASDLLVKVNVSAAGELEFTVDNDTTRYIDLNDPDNPATAGVNAGKNPLGITITDDGKTAYLMNFVSRNVSVVNLSTDSVVKVIKTTDLPDAGSQAERVLVGAEMFFSSRGNFDPVPGATISLRNRLSQTGWQACSSCHFVGLTDSVVWQFGTGPRKSVPLNGSFNPHNPDQQRVLNYSAIFDEIEDFEGNIRNTSGPGPGPAVPCDNGAQTSTFRPTHGLLLGVGNPNNPPCVVAQFIPPNANRLQLTVTLPGSSVVVPALTALKEWVQFAIRTPNGALTDAEVQGGVPLRQVIAGRALFKAAGCATCHGGEQWTSSIKDFVSPPNVADIFTERTPPPLFGNPVANQFLNRFLRDIKSFNLGVAGEGNPIDNNIGAVEKAAVAGVVAPPVMDGLGRDYNGDGRGNGFSPPSLLGIGLLPPYYHNGACETLACVLSDVNHRKAGQTSPVDILANVQVRDQVVKFLETLDAETKPIE